MVSNLSDERLDELSEMFERVNKDGPGLEPHEIESLVIEVGLTPPPNFIRRLKEMVDEIDPINEGYIDFYHFCEFVVRIEKEKDNKKEINEAFVAFDRDNDKKVDLKELEYVLKNVGEYPMTDREFRSLVQLFDQDKSGYLCYEEFEYMLEDVFKKKQ